ncbi:MAG: ATP-binding protein [bacterium]
MLKYYQMNLNGWPLLFTALASVVLGVLAIYNGPKKSSNILLTLLTLSIGLWCFAQYIGGILPDKGAVLFWTRLNLAAAILIPIFYLHFVIDLVGQTKKSFWLLALAYGAALILFVLDLTSLFVADVAPRFDLGFYPVAGPAYFLFPIYFFALFFVGVIKLYLGLKESRGEKNNQIKYIFLASLVGFLGGGTAFFPIFGFDVPILINFTIPLCLTIITYAIVRHKLISLNLVIREGLVYSGLTIFFAGFYALAIVFANRLFQNIAGLNDFMVTIAVVFISVLVFQPLREQIQGRVDRLFFRGNYYYEKTINDLNQSLQQADKMAALGVIAAGMAHEIKNPLASIKGLTQILPENLDDKEFIKKYNDIVPRQLDRINRIVEDLLAFGQPKNLAVSEVRVDKILDEVVRLVENQCRKADIEIIRDYQPIPPIQADEERLTQAFLNIILNAVQSMPKGGALTIRTNQLTNLQTNQPQLAIELSDTGAGIPPEKLAKIFDPFYTTKERGSGLGLSVTYRIIKEHGGEIVVTSQEGEGTTFKICLPTRRARSA